MASVSLFPTWLTSWLLENGSASLTSPFFSYRPSQTTVELPDFTIPTILAHLEGKDLARCSCLSKEWAYCATREPVLKRMESMRGRAEMTEMEKAKLDQKLMRAVCGGKLEEVEKLIRRGADVDTRDPVSRTPLIYAALLGYMSIVEVLLAKGAAVNAADRADWSALMHAAKDGRSPIVVALLCSGASVYLKNMEGHTALRIAKSEEHTEVVKLLIEAGAEG